MYTPNVNESTADGLESTTSHTASATPLALADRAMAGRVPTEVPAAPPPPTTVAAMGAKLVPSGVASPELVATSTAAGVTDVPPQGVVGPPADTVDTYIVSPLGML